MYYSNLEHFKGACGYEIDGIWYPRVTSIVNIKAKPALYRFYAEMSSFNEGEAVKKQSATEGTLIHETIEKILLGENPVIDSLIKPAVDAFLRFSSEKNIQVDPEWVEKKVIDYDERYAGTIDALALIDGKFGVLDIKTSQAIYRDYNLQVSAYTVPLKRQLKNISTSWILRIDQSQKCLKCGATLRTKGGREKIKSGNNSHCEHQWSEVKGSIELKELPYFENDYEAFLGAKKLWEWENEYWLKDAKYF
ncbi:MAG: hypothetical protein KY053_01170 [Candidatus Liptonbacteria bacterium]|nr:hypothetical protein [Candidatus Liptonbacteria bacterium]